MINKLKDKLYKNNDIKTFNKLADIYIYNIFKYKEITNKAEKFNKPVIQFSNLRITDNKKKLKINHFISLSKVNEIEHFRKHNNNNNYIPITFINKSHFLHDIDESREIILKSIKEMIDKYN